MSFPDKLLCQRSTLFCRRQSWIPWMVGICGNHRYQEGLMSMDYMGGKYAWIQWWLVSVDCAMVVFHVCIGSPEGIPWHHQHPCFHHQHPCFHHHDTLTVRMTSFNYTVKEHVENKNLTRHEEEQAEPGSPPYEPQHPSRVCARWVINIHHLPHQKKKKERRKGKDTAEEDEEDHMLTLTRVSLQASDEEDEPGGTCSRRADACAKSSFWQLWMCFLFPQWFPPAEQRKRLDNLTSLNVTCKLPRHLCQF